MTDDGVRLRFPKRWEAHFYTVLHLVGRGLVRLRVPVVALRGRPSIFLTKRRWRALMRALPDAHVGVILEGSPISYRLSDRMRFRSAF